MSVRRVSVLALAGLLGAGSVVFAFAPRPAPAAQTPVAKPAPTARAALGASPPPVRAEDPKFAALPALSIENQQTRERRELKLYDAFGALDDSAAAQLDELLCDARTPKVRETTRIDRRTLQLLFKAAYHFQSREVEVVSAYRKPGKRREGPHGTGSAIDFRLRGVGAKELASYLRGIPRTGVGVYTHPKTSYVHLDSREHSFHWIDASPPRRHWRERSLGGKDLQRRDATYDPALDLP